MNANARREEWVSLSSHSIFAFVKEEKERGEREKRKIRIK